MAVRTGWNTRKLQTAVARNDWDGAREALEQGADATADESLVLRKAVDQGRNDIALLAIEKGADPLARDGEAINRAVYTGNLEIFDALTGRMPQIVFHVTLAVLAQARYLSRNAGDALPDADRERLCAVVDRVEEVAAAVAEKNADAYLRNFTAAPAAAKKAGSPAP